MKLLSARWVVPVTRPPIGEGAIALGDDGTVLAVATRAELRAEFPDAVEERAQGVVLPGLVNAHCHLELSGHGDAVPGGKGLFAWATALMAARKADTPQEQREAAATAAAAAVALGTAVIGDVGNSLAAAPGIGRAGLAGVLFHELFGSRELATGDALADAARERAEAAADWPERLGYVPAGHAPYSVSPELFARIFAAAASAGRATSVHVAEDEDEIALLRDGSGRWPGLLAAMGVDPASRVPRKTPVAYLASLGAFETETPPLLVHMVHADADDRRLARDAGATVVLCPRSNLHIGGRLPDVDALVAEGGPLAIGTDSLASVPDLSLWAEMATLAAHFPAVPAARWLEAGTRGGARALGLRGLGTLEAGARPGVLDVLVDDVAAPLESLVRDPTPDPSLGDAPMTATPMNQVVKFGRMIKFEHTLFALPFALAAAAIAARGHGLSVARVAGIVIAMAGARTAAMGFNRIVDRHIDAKNPRTAGRELPTGAISLRAAWALTVAASLVFLGAAAALGPLCLALAPVALAILLGYSLTKRFTALCHLFLGLAIAGGPAGAWIAVRGDFGWTPGLLMLAVGCWIAGFDILYALADRDFDRASGLHSIPARLGVKGALVVSALLHAVTVAVLFALAPAASLGVPYLAGVAVVTALLVYEHAIVRPNDLSRLGVAFFNLNGYVSVAFFMATLADVLVR